MLAFFGFAFVVAGEAFAGLALAAGLLERLAGLLERPGDCDLRAARPLRDRGFAGDFERDGIEGKVDAAGPTI